MQGADFCKVVTEADVYFSEDARRVGGRRSLILMVSGEQSMI